MAFHVDVIRFVNRRELMEAFPREGLKIDRYFVCRKDLYDSEQVRRATEKRIAARTRSDKKKDLKVI